MVAATAKGRALMGGTTAMRAASETYLPKFGKESHESYTTRRNASWLFNGYRKTVRDMTGRVFAKSVELADDVDSRLADWCENVDLAGRDLSTFASNVFEDALSGPGIGYIMADAPRRDGTVTTAQADAGNLRPFLSHLRAEDVLGWKTETVNNITRLAQIRIAEIIAVPDPQDEFAEGSVEQVRVLDLIEGRVQVRLYRRIAKQSKWALFDGPTMTDMDEICVVPVYLNRTGFFTADPVLDDLADINVAHWQSQSDQRNILHYARVPILFGAGIAETDGITIGSETAVMAAEPQARLSWVEHGGQAIGAGRQDLKDLEFQMETFGLQLLAARPGSQSATGEALDSAKETSHLSMMADQLQDALEQALRHMATYGGLKTDPSVMVNKDFGVTLMGAQELTAMLTAVRDGVLSRTTFIEEMVRRGMIRSDIRPDEEFDRIDEDEFRGSDTALTSALPGQAGGMPN